MAEFERSMMFTADYEGLYVNHKADKGGATKYGISLKFLKALGIDINQDGVTDEKDIIELTKEESQAIYKKYIWDPLKLDHMPSEKVAFMLFDASVNHGQGNAVKFAQRACNVFGKGLVVDGMYGPKTMKAIIEISEDEFVEEYLKVREQFFYAIVKNNPSQDVFLKGWLNRIVKCRRDANLFG